MTARCLSVYLDDSSGDEILMIADAKWETAVCPIALDVRRLVRLEIQQGAAMLVIGIEQDEHDDNVFRISELPLGFSITCSATSNGSSQLVNIFGATKPLHVASIFATTDGNETRFYEAVFNPEFAS